MTVFLGPVMGGAPSVDSGIQTYAGTINWATGTPPSGSTSHQYRWQRVGSLIHLQIFLYYSVAGASNTLLALTLPTGAPSIQQWTGKTAGSLSQYPGDGYFFTADAATPARAQTYIRNTNELLSVVASGAYKHCLTSYTYFTA